MDLVNQKFRIYKYQHNQTNTLITRDSLDFLRQQHLKMQIQCTNQTTKNQYILRKIDRPIIALPSIDHSITGLLEPPEALPERAFELSFHSVHLVASDPLLPLQLRITEVPAFRSRPICRLALIEFVVVVVIIGATHLGFWWVCKGGTVTPEILHPINAR